MMVGRMMQYQSSQQPSIALQARSRRRASIRHRRDAFDAFARLRWRGRSESPRHHVETTTALIHLHWSEGKVGLPSPLFLITTIEGDYCFITTSQGDRSHSNAIEGSMQVKRYLHQWGMLCRVDMENSLLCRRRLANAL